MYQLYKVSFSTCELKPLEYLDGLAFDGFFLLSPYKRVVPISRFNLNRGTLLQINSEFIKKVDITSEEEKILSTFKQNIYDQVLGAISHGQEYQDLNILFAPSFTDGTQSHQNHIIRYDLLPLLFEKANAKHLLDELLLSQLPMEEKQRLSRNRFLGRIIYTYYNNLLYIVKDICFNINPLSQFGRTPNELHTFQEFYMKKYNIQIEDLNQPLFLHGMSRLKPEDSIHTQIDGKYVCNHKSHVHLVPELCLVSGITHEMRQLALLLPLIWKHYQSHFKLDMFAEKHQISMKNPRLLRTAFTHPSYTNEVEGKLSSYQRLEFVGDSIVNFFATSKLYYAFPNAEEGELSRHRVSIICNEFLSIIGQEMGCQDVLIHNLENKSMKSLADCVEAMIGAVFLDSGLIAAEQLFNHCFFSTGSMNDPLRTFFAQCDVRPENSCPTTTTDYNELSLQFAPVEEIIGISFKDKNLLIQAFTHPTYYMEIRRTKNQHVPSSRGHYQRLELLGDSLLALVVSVYLYTQYPAASEGEMSVCRAQMVSNAFLAKCTQDLRLDDFFRHHWSSVLFDGPRREKACADIMESIIGALYVDQGLSACCQFIAKHIISKSTIDPSAAFIDPKSVYMHLMKANYNVFPEYRILDTVASQYGFIYEIGIFVDNKQITSLRGLSIRQVEMRLAEKALAIYFEDDHVKVTTSDEQLITIKKPVNEKLMNRSIDHFSNSSFGNKQSIKL